MSTYNERPEWVRESIESILQQSYKNIEFVIVSDSPENTEVNNILSTYSTIDNRIKLFFNSRNEGLVYSLNKALSYCTGTYIARMDADDISHKDRLYKQLKYLNDNNLDLIGSNVNLFNETDGVFFITNKLISHKYLKKMLAAGTIGIVHPTFFARRKVFDTLNGYKMCLHAEDQEFLGRAIANNFKVGNTSEILLDCRYHPNSVTKSNAIYTYKMASYSTQVFRNYLKTGQYIFDDSYYRKISVSEKELVRFNKKQIRMSEARKNINNKAIFPFFINIAKATYYSTSTIDNIRINLKLKQYRTLERISNK